jgi:phosphate-selective porin OprO/OprP
MKIKLLASLMAATTLFATSADAEVKVSTDGGLKVSSGDASIQIGGRLMYDYNRSELNGVVDEDQFDDRRARLYVKGNFSRDWAYKSQFNLDGSGFEDLYLRYLGWGKAAQLTIGNQRLPFGLEDQTSSNDISVLERSAITEQYAVGRIESIQLHGSMGNSTYGVMLFSDDVNEDEPGEEFGISGRYTFAPVKTDTSLVHLGTAYYDIDENSAFGLEGAFVTGPFHLQAEFMDGEFGDQEGDGFYVQAGYVFTGEMRPYKDGVFKRVTPKGKGGAWEAVVRYEDGFGNFSDIELGRTEASAFTVGLNWYAHKNVRIGMNYTDGEDDLTGDDGNEFRVRFGFAF